MDLRSPLGKVKGLGSAKNGSHHWWMQRVTALALIPLVIWLVYIVLSAVNNDANIVDYMVRPFNAVLMLIFLAASLYHGTLGIRVVIEDYVKCSCMKNFLIIGINFFVTITAVASMVAVITLHIAAFQESKSDNVKKNDYAFITSSKTRSVII
jgi:succinate dehydrogenase / fumarate reductase membrane anchor subunit